ncbi:MAG: AtpZ/AtpI family protein [Actinomycetota bacterium]|nr:AtpZ/AtpI family protein [Actinomycetota bacterium]
MVSDNNRELYRGVDDGWTRAIEMVVTPIVAGAVGFGLDHLVGTLPLFTILFGIMAVVASFVKMYYVYDAEMRAHDAVAPWGAAGRNAETTELSTASSASTPPDDANPVPPRRHHGSATKHRSAAGLGGS